MRCITIEKIYLYLEKELSPAEHKENKKHLAVCPRCQKALEERRLLIQAADELPLWEIPSDFPQQVMERILATRAPLKAWIGAISAGFASMVLALFIYSLASGQNIVNLFVHINDALWTAIRDIPPLLVKLIKLASIFITIFLQFLGWILKSLSSLTTIISPEVQITVTVITLVLIVSSIYGLRKKFLFGDKA